MGYWTQAAQRMTRPYDPIRSHQSNEWSSPLFRSTIDVPLTTGTYNDV
jgi:hypothetical protein